MATNGVASRAEVLRWFAAHEGKQFLTRRVSDGGARVWEPGPRTLSIRSKTRILFNGSFFEFNTGDEVREFDGKHVTIDSPAWGATVTYTLVEEN